VTRDVCIWFTRENYAAHRALDPDGLQMSFDEWIQTVERGLKQLELQGIVPARVVIDPTDFAAWCRGEGREINGDARMAFAVIVHNKRRMN
jgi:hypothetical protein